jgi:hypothetical protein
MDAGMVSRFDLVLKPDYGSWMQSIVAWLGGLRLSRMTGIAHAKNSEYRPNGCALEITRQMITVLARGLNRSLAA